MFSFFIGVMTVQQIMKYIKFKESYSLKFIIHFKFFNSFKKINGSI